ncbi:hypothetical protein AMK26_22420 [Streptomyces sp. CB03234]|uniref:hypothetical protein n=1 Tax=Streptomyces sp. (strain CB03234) TaxID=1703937 RepID=UPI00093F492E|nr:hypothetical protein [Streptomyces sp. CB03234]OKK02416.1 hypothetical protein AMK26_22420 [Streptomyces sp. CB03234]
MTKIQTLDGLVDEPLSTIEGLVAALRRNEEQQQGLRNLHAEFTRQIVRKAGGVQQAAEILGIDPKTVRAHERAAGVVMVVYRGRNTEKVDADGRVYGETGQGEESDGQLEADRKWFKISPGHQGRLLAVVYVFDGTVVRVREVEDRRWEWDDNGEKAALPLGAPLTAEELAERFPTLPFTLGGAHPMVRGKIREYVAL